MLRIEQRGPQAGPGSRVAWTWKSTERHAMTEQPRHRRADEEVDDTGTAVPERGTDDVEGEDLGDVVDRMEDRLENERRESDVDGHIGEREEITPVEPDDQAPS